MKRALLAVVMVLAACTTTNTVRVAPRVIVVVGDSIVRGNRLEQLEDRWTNQLQLLMPTAIVVNSGAGGGTVVAPDPNGGNSLTQRFAADVLAVHDVTDVVIAAGVNDLIHIPDEQIAQALLDLAQQARTRGVRAIVLPILPLTDGRLDGAHVNELLRAGGPVCPTDQAVSKGGLLDPVYALSDGLHLNPEGNRVVAATVAVCLNGG